MNKNFILTHPCIGNYGGMLQAYALQHVIYKHFKINTSVIDYIPNDVIKLRRNYKYHLRCFVSMLLSHFCSRLAITPIAYFMKMADSFKMFFLNATPINNSNLPSTQNISYIVGSDQVWRAQYARNMLTVPYYFLDFTSKSVRNNSFSYAASFGVDEWEGTPEETEECKRLLQEFKAVSVREHSGVKICKETFGVEAVQMPDPTLLLHKADYGAIIDSEQTWLPEGKIVGAYVLDKTEKKAELLQESADTLNLQLQHLMPHANAKKRRDRFPISVPQWLRLIRDCEYFVTDSFHGCVFAIIFNKPFVCLGNAGRGSARFDTLLGTFGLESRLITDATPEKIQQVLQTPIDWEKINAIHDAERERGINFLKENLSE